MGGPAPIDRRIETADGLKLHVRDWTPEAPDGPPVVCLPGLARTLEDFVPLATFLSSPDGGNRRVLAISARGRGLSDRDPDPLNYTLKTESEDVIHVLVSLSIGRGAFIGTSRGGLQSMMIAALRPGLPAAVVLNDIGPVIEAAGLKRIRDALLDGRAPADWREAADLLESAHAARFPALDREDFERWAHRAWREGRTGLEPACDPALSVTMTGLDLDKPIAPLWALFDALAAIPLMTVRGGLSDILSAEALDDMAARRPDLVRHVTPGQGHAPLLDDAPTMGAVARFLGRVSD